jgi:hypothetical protein
MNKKVFVSMLTLCVVFLAGLYVAKIFFPQEFVGAVSIEAIIKIGDLIDGSIIAYYIFHILVSVLTYTLYLCAIMHKKILNWREMLIVLAVIGGNIGISFYDTTFSTYYGIIAMVLLPRLLKGDMQYMPIVFVVHSVSQLLSLKIRDLPMYLVQSNSIMFLCLTIDMYLWLALFYIIGNYKNKQKEN